ncbi:helix-turn-helix transcriptional regulator [Flavobacterium sp. FZUC8N2.13]|uniref:Helix-turn-helix transcriptional regulator n=1 Tax=Flavobacterium zubiriense TaxID=3138075 RepID=A0ABV4TCM0_9FLAO
MKEQNVVVTMLLEEKRNKVASIIQTARVQKGWSQTGLGDRVGFSRSTIARIEACAFSPNADQLYMILECLDLTLKIGNEEI